MIVLEFCLKYKKAYLRVFILFLLSSGLLNSGCSYILTGDNSNSHYDWIHDKSVFIGTGYYLPQPHYYDTYALYLDTIEKQTSTILKVDERGYHELVEEMTTGNKYTSL